MNEKQKSKSCLESFTYNMKSFCWSFSWKHERHEEKWACKDQMNEQTLFWKGKELAMQAIWRSVFLHKKILKKEVLCILTEIHNLVWSGLATNRKQRNVIQCLSTNFVIKMWINWIFYLQGVDIYLSVWVVTESPKSWDLWPVTFRYCYSHLMTPCLVSDFLNKCPWLC